MNANSDLEQLYQEITRHYLAINTFQFDYLYITSDLRNLAFNFPNYETKDAFCRAILKPLFEFGKTLLIPTFSYTTSGIFNTESTATSLGTLSHWILSAEGVLRSEHPLFSVAALGPGADIVRAVGRAAFGSDSVYDRLNRVNAAYLHIGRPVSLGNTSIHFVEDQYDVIYRFRKEFSTEVFRGTERCGTSYSAFVRRLDIPGHTFVTDFTRATVALHNAGILREVMMRSESPSNISCFSCCESAELFLQCINKDPNFFIGKPFYGTSLFRGRTSSH